MLARTPYLTAQELGIREIEHEYLSRFVSEGEQGRLPEQHRLDMSHMLYVWNYGKSDCGSAGCIAGTMDAYALHDGRQHVLRGTTLNEPYGRTFEAAHPPRGQLFNLFYGEGFTPRTRATLDQAVSCTKHFLQTGVVDWPLALGEQS